jgi:hypothetical protein
VEPLTAKLRQHRVQVGAGAAAAMPALIAWRKRA